MTSILTLDLGTGGIRAGLYDVEKGRMRAQAERAYPTAYPRRGWAEQNPEDWWSALVFAARAVLAETATREVAGVCVAATSSTVVACRADRTLLRPAILWMDCRAAEESHLTETVKHPVLAYSGGGDAVEWLVPKAMWLARHEPEIYRQAEVICEAVDFLNFRLTGRWAGSRLNATCKWNYDPLERRFRPDLFAAFGVPDLLTKLPREIVAVGDGVERMAPAVAAELGISGRPLVAQGGIDAHMGVFGAGTVAPGGMLMVGGTSAVHLTQMDRQPDLPGIWGPYPNALVDGLWLIEGGQVSAGSILQWLSERIFGLDDAGGAALIAEAAKLGIGETGLLTLDYWMGNRTPYRDPNLRGAIFGLSLWHDRATIYRSAVEAIALGSANVVAGLLARGVSLDRFVLSGGICKNPLWLRATVDAIGMPIHVARDDNLSLVGGAVSAAAALGLFPGLTAASKACAAPAAIIEPDASAHVRFTEMLQSYREATETAAPIAHRLARTPQPQERMT
ncbi:MAG: FGGY-family carbohydrate kinase [Roseiarcus sp.]|jgi:ribulose kinase